MPVTGPHGRPSRLVQRLELQYVDFVVAGLEKVAGRPGEDAATDVGPEGDPEPSDVVADCALPRGRRCAPSIPPRQERQHARRRQRGRPGPPAATVAAPPGTSNEQSWLRTDNGPKQPDPHQPHRLTFGRRRKISVMSA